METKNRFFMFNPKSYFYGSELIELAKAADKAAKIYDVKVIMTVPYPDIYAVRYNTKNIEIAAQHLDGIVPGKGMGYSVPESLHNAGARYTILNHAEHPLTINELYKSILRSRELGIKVIACANSVLESTAIAVFKPDIILCEPDNLIGSGTISDDVYVSETVKAIKNIDATIAVMHGAGIRTTGDVTSLLRLGADAVGVTSGITLTDNPKKALHEMIKIISNENKQQ